MREIERTYVCDVNNFCSRFPRLFELRTSKSDPNTSPSPCQDYTHLRNTATNDSYPLTPPTSTLDTLHILGGALEDDFLFLLPSPDGDGYTLQGFVTCFPSGFDTSRKFGLKLREIHGPVPGYREKLEGSMDRYFERLEVGKFVMRVNVGVPFSSPLHPWALEGSFCQRE